MKTESEQKLPGGAGRQPRSSRAGGASSADGDVSITELEDALEQIWSELQTDMENRNASVTSSEKEWIENATDEDAISETIAIIERLDKGVAAERIAVKDLIHKMHK